MFVFLFENARFFLYFLAPPFIGNCFSKKIKAAFLGGFLFFRFITNCIGEIRAESRLVRISLFAYRYAV